MRTLKQAFISSCLGATSRSPSPRGFDHPLLHMQQSAMEAPAKKHWYYKAPPQSCRRCAFHQIAFITQVSLHPAITCLVASRRIFATPCERVRHGDVAWALLALTCIAALPNGPNWPYICRHPIKGHRWQGTCSSTCLRQASVLISACRRQPTQWHK